MTAEQQSRIRQEIIKTYADIARFERYSLTFRDNALIALWKLHAAKLEKSLELNQVPSMN